MYSIITWIQAIVRLSIRQVTIYVYIKIAPHNLCQGDMINYDSNFIIILFLCKILTDTKFSNAANLVHL